MPSPAVRNVFLVGPMGTGKTTVGRALADLIGWPFADSDQEIEKRTGATIPWIFEKEGESGFRGREAIVLDELTQQSGLVLATGGGAVLQLANQQWLSGRGTVIYLHAPVEVQLARTARDRNRPILNVPDPEERLRELMVIRDPIYRHLAHFTLSTQDGSARELALQIIDLIQLEVSPWAEASLSRD